MLGHVWQVWQANPALQSAKNRIRQQIAQKRLLMKPGVRNLGPMARRATEDKPKLLG